MIANLEKIILEALREELRLSPDLGRFNRFQREQINASLKSITKDVVDGWEIDILGADFAKWVNVGLKANPSYNFGQGGGYKSELFLKMHEFTRTFAGNKSRSAAFMIMRSKKRAGIKGAFFVEATIEKHTEEFKQAVTGYLIERISNNIQNEISKWQPLQ